MNWWIVAGAIYAIAILAIFGLLKAASFHDRELIKDSDRTVPIR